MLVVKVVESLLRDDREIKIPLPHSKSLVG
jgi:hypothetical protein